MQALLDLSDKAKSLDKQKSQLLNRMQSRNHDKPAQQIQAVAAPVASPEQAAIQQVRLITLTYALLHALFDVVTQYIHLPHTYS